MKLYICWGTFQTPRPAGIPARTPTTALRDAGHDPEVQKVHGLGIGPSFLNVMTDGRREVEELTGQREVPVLVTDTGEIIQDSQDRPGRRPTRPLTGRKADGRDSGSPPLLDRAGFVAGMPAQARGSRRYCPITARPTA